MNRTYIIADIGACHDGSLARMQDAISAAKRAGCDAIKFQWTSDHHLMAARRGNALDHGYADIYARYLRFPEEWLGVLQAACKAQGIDFMCTVFLPQDVPSVARLVSHFKVAAFESEDRLMLEACKEHRSGNQKVIVSLGMGTTARSATDMAMRAPALPRRHLVLMHCVSSYPTPDAELNISRVRRQRLLGFSDHSLPDCSLSGALAVACGARFLEAHLRLPSTDPKNPDFPHARTESQFAAYCADARKAESMCGDGREGQRRCEEKMSDFKTRESRDH